MAIPTIDTQVLQSVCDVLGATDSGLTGSEIARLLASCGIDDPIPGHTKRHRLFEALSARQNRDGCANNVINFVQEAMNPVRHVGDEESFQSRRSPLNEVLSFAGLSMREDGKVVSAAKATTLTQAAQRADELRRILRDRNVHPDVLSFCREELLVNNYFHAVFEATKSVAEKIRQRSGLLLDGSELVDAAFAFKHTIPHLAFSSLQSESEKSEQRGFMNLLKGLFGTFRNTTAHAPKITWPIDKLDALDILSLVSLVHRRLDQAVNAKNVTNAATKT